MRHLTSEPRWQATAQGARLRGWLSGQDGQSSYECGYWLDNDEAAFEAWARGWLSQIIGQSAVDERRFHVEMFERRSPARARSARPEGER